MNYKYMQKADKNIAPSFKFSNEVLNVIDFESIKKENSFAKIKKPVEEKFESKYDEEDNVTEQDQTHRSIEERRETNVSKSKSRSKSRPRVSGIKQDDMRFSNERIEEKIRNSEAEEFIQLQKEIMGENLKKMEIPEKKEPEKKVNKAKPKRKYKTKKDSFDNSLDPESQRMHALILKKKNPKSLSMQEKALLRSYQQSKH